MPENRVSYRVPKAHGPKITVIGGGHGLSTMLRGLKNYTENLTAVVTVACSRAFSPATSPWSSPTCPVTTG